MAVHAASKGKRRTSRSPASPSPATRTADERRVLPFERRFWLLQRAMWVVGAAILTAALLGVFGRGPLSHAHAASEDGRLRLDYQRFTRNNAPDELVFHIAPSPGQEHVRLRVSRAYMRAVRPEVISPRPAAESADGEWSVYDFTVAHGGASFAVTFTLNIEHVGPVHAAADLDGAGSLTFGQFVYP